jgi:hypothetical protein
MNGWKFVPLALSFLCGVASGEVRLITGDADDAPHQHSSTLMDLSADGDLVLFLTGPPVTGSTPGIAQGGLYLRRLSTGTLDFVGDNSVTFPGVVDASVSDDGRYIAWSTSADHIYWRDVQADVTRLVTAGANNDSARPILSADGRYVVFGSAARNLIADTGKLQSAGRVGLYRYDSETQQIQIVALSSTGAALVGGVGSSSAAAAGFNEYDFSADGRYVVFSSDATNAHPDRPAAMGAGAPCVYRRDLQTGTLLMLNRNAAGTPADGNFTTPRVSADGDRVTFFGGFVGLFGGGTLGISGPSQFASDMYVKDVSDGSLWWASRTTDGTASDGVFGSFNAISGDGETVSFSSSGTKFVAGATDAGGGNSGTSDIFRVDLGSGGTVTTSQVTLSPAGSGNVDWRVGPLLPGTGDYVAFSTSQVQAMLGTGNQDTPFFQGFAVGTLPAAGGGALSFASWAAALPEGERGYGDNPAGDGVANLVKYFTGMDPAAPDLSHLPEQGSSPGHLLGLPGDTAEYLTLSLRVRRDLPPGFTWEVRTGPDPAALAPGAAVQVGSPVADGDFDLHLFRYPSPLSGRGFMDVKFTAP